MPEKLVRKNMQKKVYIGGVILFTVLLILFLTVVFYGNTFLYLLPFSSGESGQQFVADEEGRKNDETREEKMARLVSQASQVGANELGKVPILLYHRIGDEEGRWTRTPDNFRKDLQELYKRGFVLVPLSDYLKGVIKVPAGKSPAIITFDNSSAGQFRLFSKAEGENGKRDVLDLSEVNKSTKQSLFSDFKVDPDCAVGILLDFSKKHPDFGHYATFYINGRPFSNEKGQEILWKEKLQFLRENNFEIGNHTMNHAYLKDLTSEEIEKEIALLQQHIQEAVPGYRPNSFAIVQDGIPEHYENVISGEYNETAYRHQGVLLCAWKAAESPFHVDFNPFKLQRIQVFNDKSGSTLTMWLERIQKEQYVSDGNNKTIAFPKSWGGTLDPKTVKNGMEIIPYDEQKKDVRNPDKEKQAENARGVHVSISYASSEKRWNDIISLVESTGLNTIQLDIKDETGMVGYETGVPMAQEIGAVKYKLPMQKMLTELEERGIYSIARLVVFRDPVLAGKRPQYMVKTSSGLPVAGGVWVNPYSREVWDYNIALAREALEMGFDEVQFDYIRFPEGRLSQFAEYGSAAQGTNKVETITNFLNYARLELGWQSRLSAAVFGFVGYAKDDLNIGQCTVSEKSSRFP